MIAVPYSMFRLLRTACAGVVLLGLRVVCLFTFYLVAGEVEVECIVQALAVAAFDDFH